MAVYRYIASEPSSGSTRRGELTADSAYQVRAALRRMALQPVHVKEVHAARTRSSQQRAWTGLSSKVSGSLERLARSRRRAALVEFYESLATLIGTGTTLAGSLELLSRQQESSGRHSWAWSTTQSESSTLARLLAERVQRGDTLAQAMAQPPGPAWFGRIDCSLVAVAHESGELERALSDLAEHHGRSERLKGRLAAVLAYPALLLVFGMGVVVFLTTTTLPPLAAVLEDAKVELPMPTKILLAFGHLLGSWWLASIPILVGVAAALFWLATSPRFARARLGVPLLGTVLSRGQLGEACILLSRLIKGGVPFTEALRLIDHSVPNAALRSALEKFRGALESGQAPGTALNHSTVFEPVFQRVLEVGEASGEMAPALETIGQRYRHSASRLTDRLAAALEPTVILILAAMIGFVVYAAITPMLKLSQTIH